MNKENTKVINYFNLKTITPIKLPSQMKRKTTELENAGLNPDTPENSYKSNKRILIESQLSNIKASQEEDSDKTQYKQQSLFQVKQIIRVPFQLIQKLKRPLYFQIFDKIIQDEVYDINNEINVTKRTDIVQNNQALTQFLVNNFFLF
jgi:hypothetical protein